VLDLIARAMQAGHAFTSALQMAANDAKPPLSAQLHKVFDEIHFGLDLRQAMSGLAERIDSDDVRFFVTAVLVQHETGGNLADILRNTATLIRERQKIRGVIRVLSGEGRISAWILSLLPFALAGVLNLVNPEFMSALWTDPKGVQMLYVCVLLMLAGIVWMWRLIDIRI
jgi:tight adherence protein B